MLLFWILFGIGLIVAGVVILIIHFNKKCNSNNSKRALNNQVLAGLQEDGFEISKIFYLNDDTCNSSDKMTKKIVAVNEKDRKIVLVDYENSSSVIVKFGDILNFEIYKNGSSVTNGGAAGGLIFGIFGAETSANCREMRLIIRLRNYKISQVSYNIITERLQESATCYRECVASLQNFTSFLQVIIDENEKQNKSEN